VILETSPVEPRAPRALRLPQVREQVARLSPDLDPESSTFRAAVLLLASRTLGQNVDRLARFSGAPRDFVARCARRLVDNGVWQRGRTVATWTDPETADFGFWADVGVAEGRLCRRLDENGHPEWAQAGEWWKSFDLIPPSAESGMALRYRPRCRVVPASELVLEPREETVEEPQPEPARRDRPGPAPEPRWIGAPETGGAPVTFLGAPEHFRGVKWLS
jgi:hypothetical protein